MLDPEDTYLVISPPRSSSTAFARVIWNNPGIRYYSHEPYESAYFHTLGPEHADEAMRNPIDLAPVTAHKQGAGILVKEISFQIGAHLERFLATSAHPVVFLIRDPRLTVSSRRRVKERQRQALSFPLAETGWQALTEQVRYCRELGAPYLITDSFDFRSRPETVFARIYAAWGLRFDPAQLSWKPRPGMALSNYRDDGVDHFFTRVLNSTGIEPPVEQPGAVADFPDDGGLRDHVAWALEQYRELRRDDRFVGADLTDAVSTASAGD